MKSLLESGVHFGHQTRRWNPKMGKFIFGSRNKIHIIDLQKTLKEFKKVYKVVRDFAAEGKDFLFVRVDLYEINDKIYFGELTFTPGNATINYYNQETLDFLGEKLILPLDSQD